ncbi:hypothetical protein [Symbiopectobacterium purcellii]|uniref:hypothetical protein n=1 Tax=Symbiopectobacterium purcellii TaxID=2871826 RepID=UPI003F874244
MTIANRLKNDYILCPDMRQRGIAGCYQNNVAWLYSWRCDCIFLLKPITDSDLIRPRIPA